MVSSETIHDVTIKREADQKERGERVCSQLNRNSLQDVLQKA